MRYKITSQRALKDTFWKFHPQFKKRHVTTETVVAWCDWCDHMVRGGVVSQDLVNRARLTRRRA
jgi:hypothetical protein